MGERAGGRGRGLERYGEMEGRKRERQRKKEGVGEIWKKIRSTEGGLKAWR